MITYYSYVKSLVESDVGAEEGFARLVEYCENERPDPVWNKIRGIEIRSDITYLGAWLKLVLADEPPAQDIRAFCFGIYNPVRMDTVSCDMSLSGSTRFDAEDDDWACWYDDSYVPRGGDSNSRVLHEIYAILDGSNVNQFGQYVLCLGYACLVVKEIFADATLPVAVGFHDGDMILVKS